MKKLFIFILLVISSVLHALPLQVDSTGAITGPVTSAQFTARISSALTSADAVTFTGDSMTLGNALPAGQSYPEALHLLSNFSAVTSWSNVAVGGRSITNLISAYAAEVYPRRPAGLGVTRSYLFLWTGTTNYASADLETNWTNISSYMTTAKADGFTLIVITIPRRTSPPSATGDYEAKRQILNDRMRLSDIPYMVIDADKIFTNGIENTDVSIDGTHLSYASNKRLAQYINSIWPLGDPHSFGASPIFEKVSIGGTEPNACAALDISSTTKGLLPPRMTTSQKDAISSPTNGLVVYDTTLNKLSVYENDTWVTYQPIDSDLTSIAGLDFSDGLNPAGDWLFPAKTVGGSWNARRISAFIEDVLDDTDAATVQTTLSLVPGTNVQIYSANLSTLAGVTPGTFGQTVLALETASDLIWVRASSIYDGGNDVTIFAGADGEATFANFSVLNLLGSTKVAFQDALEIVASSRIGTEVTTAANGTAATIGTTEDATLDFGTTDPTVTLSADGVWRIFATVTIDYLGATFASNRTLTLKVRRTNNTATDVTGAIQYLNTNTVTALTLPSQTITIPVMDYNGSSGDILAIVGSLTVAPSAGSVQASAAQISIKRIK